MTELRRIPRGSGAAQALGRDHAQQIAGHASPKTTKLYDQTTGTRHHRPANASVIENYGRTDFGPPPDRVPVVAANGRAIAHDSSAADGAIIASMGSCSASIRGNSLSSVSGARAHQNVKAFRAAPNRYQPQQRTANGDSER